MMGKIKPFIQIFSNGNRPVSRWQLLKTLGRLAILKRSHPKDSPVSVPFGKQIIYGPDYALISFLLKEKFVAQEYYFKTGNPAPVIVDGGASIGISAMYFKSLYNGAIVHSFEPYSKAFQFLNLNVSANQLRNVFLYNMAIAEQDGPVIMYIPEKGEMINASVKEKKGSGVKTEIVQAIKLSRVLKDIPVTDLLKLDVEGSEFPVITELNNSGLLSSKKIKRCIIEYHYDVQHDPAQLAILLETFRNNHYHVITKRLYKENPASDLLITAWQDS